MTQRVRMLVLAVLICGLTAAVQGQSTFATITGAVQDPSGAIIPGATIEATHAQRDNKYTTTSNEAGLYTLANLPAGTYLLEVKAAGFQAFKASDIIVTGRDIRRIDATLTVGQTSTSVEVSAGATLIETETARIAESKDREVLRALPLTLRRAWDFFTMTPQMERTGGWNVRLAGSGEMQSTATMDGVSLDTAWGAPIGPLMDRTEMVQEVRVDIAQGGADMATMGQVSMISRGGTNELHGSVADYYNNAKLNSRNPFSLVKTPGWGHQLVAGVGGPIYIPKVYDGRNKSFFFYNVEVAVGPVAPFLIQRNVPLNRWRAGDFASLAGTVIKDPMNGGAPFPNNVLPTSRINGASTKFQEMLIPKQNNGSADVFDTKVPTYVRTFPGFPFVHQPTITYRLDHRISDKQFIYGRWTSVRWNNTQPETVFPELTEKRNAQRNMDNITASHSYSISSSLLNEVRFGLNSQRAPNESAWRGLDVVKQLGFQGLAPNLPDVPGLPRISFQRSGVAEVASVNNCNPCDQHNILLLTDNLQWFRGGHNIRMGTNIRKSNYQQMSQGNGLFGSSVFSGNFSGFDYADFLLGIPTTLSRNFPSLGQNQTRWNQGYYFQDDWRISSRLTLNLGLRWDAIMPWTEKSGRLAMFDPVTAKIVVPDGSLNLMSPLMPTGYIDVIEASKAGYPSKTLIKTDWNNWQPRLGFAYRPWDNRTVFRGGFGIAYNQGPSGTTTAGIPYVINEPSYTNPAGNPIVWPQVFPTSSTGGPTTVSIPGAVRPDIQIARVIQYSFTIEHQRWDTGFQLSYNGTGTRGGTWGQNINQPVADGRLYIEKTRRFPKYPDIGYQQNGAGHQYHGLTAQVLRRQKGGFYYQTYFTWAKDIFDLETGSSPEDAYDRTRERGLFDRQANMRLSGNAVYELPFGKGRKFMHDAHWLANGLLGGWRVSTIMALESGRPMTPTWTGPDPTGTRYTTSSTRPNVTLRADALRDWQIDNPSQYGWFDVKAFAGPPIGRFGTASKGMIVGPGTRVMHNSIAKEFPIRERAKLRFEVLATNSLNHPNWVNPQTNITNAAAGLILGVVDRNTKFDTGIPREVQLHLRVEW